MTQLSNLIIMQQDGVDVAVDDIFNYLDRTAQASGIEISQVALDTLSSLNQSSQVSLDAVGRMVENHLISLIAVLIAHKLDRDDTQEPLEGRKAGARFLHLWHTEHRESIIRCEMITNEAIAFGKMLAVVGDVATAKLRFRSLIANSVPLQPYAEFVANKVVDAAKEKRQINEGSQRVLAILKDLISPEGGSYQAMTPTYALASATQDFDPERTLAAGVANLIFAANIGKVPVDALAPLVDYLREFPDVDQFVQSYAIGFFSRDSIGNGENNLGDLLDDIRKMFGG